VDACAESGVRGLLLDTSRKTGGSLFASVDTGMLTAVRRRATGRGIWLALAGGMTMERMELLTEVRPHVIGVRGAACDGPRTGVLSRDRVEQLRHALDGIIRRLQPQGLPV
jgi:uncharacterized protein (UPF0264 family)